MKSKPGEGSTFTLFVPLQVAPSAASAAGDTVARYDNSGAVAALKWQVWRMERQV